MRLRSLIPAVVLLTACVLAVPYNECGEVYFSMEEVRACEERAVRREDRKAAEAIKAVEAERKARLCWLQGKYYDKNDGWCKSILR